MQIKTCVRDAESYSFKAMDWSVGIAKNLKADTIWEVKPGTDLKYSSMYKVWTKSRGEVFKKGMAVVKSGPTNRLFN